VVREFVGFEPHRGASRGRTLAGKGAHPVNLGRPGVSDRSRPILISPTRQADARRGRGSFAGSAGKSSGRAMATAVAAARYDMDAEL
jgi:hypothetical protein